MKPEDTKVIMVTNYYLPYVGGITTYIKFLADGLEEKGFETRVLSIPEPLRNIELGINNTTLRKLVHQLLLIIFVVTAELSILRTRFRYRNVIVHSHSAGFCLLTGVIAGSLGCRSIHTYHSPVEGRHRFLEILSPKADALIFVSNEARELYHSTSKVKNDFEEIIPGVIDENKYKPKIGSALKTIEKEYAATIGKNRMRHKKLLFVGRVVEIKGVHVLLESLDIIRRKVPDIILFIAGPYSHGGAEKKYYHKLVKYIEEHGLKDMVVFKGPLQYKELMDIYAIADVVVVPSLWEASPLVPMEAMALGKPVVGTRVGGLEPMIVHGRTGYLVAKNDPEGLADRIVELLTNEKRLRKMSRNARSYVEKEHSIDAMVKKHVKVYDKLYS